MVVDYLLSIQSELLDKKQALEKEISDLLIELRQNQEFLKVLESNEELNFDSFTPRQVTPSNKEKIISLKDKEHNIQESINDANSKYSDILNKLNDLEDVLKSLESTDDAKISILLAQETERQRISRDLHDSTVQNLTALVYKVEICSKLLDSDPVRCKLELLTMEKNLRDIIQDTREMIYDLRPMSFDDIGLDVTMERAVDKLKQSYNKNIDFTVVGEPFTIAPVVGITLLRILQEACSNAIHHADCSHIVASLEYKKDSVALIVKDDGCGFDSKSVSSDSRNDNSGFGLSTMKERVYLLSGRIDIDSHINKGTIITVEVPTGHM